MLLNVLVGLVKYKQSTLAVLHDVARVVAALNKEEITSDAAVGESLFYLEGEIHVWIKDHVQPIEIFEKLNWKFNKKNL